MATISFVFKGSLPDGTVFDDSTNEPLEIVTGRSQIMPVLEQALLEMSVGEERVLEISAKDAYGDYDETALQRVPTYLIPNGESLPEGEIIMWTSPRNNKPIPVTIRSKINQVAELDFNHPLAGKDIVYWVKLLDRQ